MSTLCSSNPATMGQPIPAIGYIHVPIDLLLRLNAAPVDLFFQSHSSSEPALYCRAGLTLDHAPLSNLVEVGICDIYVRMGDLQELGASLRDAIRAGGDEAPAADQFAALQLAAAAEIEQTVRLVDCSKFVALAREIGRDIVSFISSAKVLPSELFNIARHDYNTFVHVTNVASYSVILAQRLGVSDVAELEQIATAAMLHDLGKRHIPLKILNKSTRLDPHERELIELHPTRGYVELCTRADLTHSQLMIVYQHHERIDGGGYPVGVLGTDIDPWAKMVAVVDVFDALTGKRPYRRPTTAANAIDFLSRNAGPHFDAEMVKCWVSALKQT
ncbi:MAG: HD domain-containing protein [Planctomycetaceae bacterium]|nr:HD domain-containing protein [Planctomycetaceae bacterium]